MIRRYEQADLTACAAVFCAAFSAEPWNENWTDSLAETRISELMCSPLSVGYVYEENGEIIGFAAGRNVTYLFGREYMIDEFCIRPERQGRGTGSEMLTFIAADQKRSGTVNIVLNTSKGLPSEKFYLKNGFRQAENMIFMSLNLTESYYKS
ncbi:MAG: GNAT family N-acetyltransferase [Oscillospiraceae bacterium]|nr:GNAT family N-acetyltransferase [Oscillospiraceae bacterium]